MQSVCLVWLGRDIVQVLVLCRIDDFGIFIVVMDPDVHHLHHSYSLALERLRAVESTIIA